MTEIPTQGEPTPEETAEIAAAELKDTGPQVPSPSSVPSGWSRESAPISTPVW